MNLSQMNLIRKLGLLYAVMFFITASLAYIPGLTDGTGNLFGLFQLDLYDDLLHFASGVWATVAALTSTRATIFYFKTFGIMYGLDGLLGLITGHGYLDGGIFLAQKSDLFDTVTNFALTQLYLPLASFFFAHSGPGAHDLTTRIFANLPHIVIGGAAVYIGFVLSRQFASDV